MLRIYTPVRSSQTLYDTPPHPALQRVGAVSQLDQLLLIGALAYSRPHNTTLYRFYSVHQLCPAPHKTGPAPNKINTVKPLLCDLPWEH
jgi:hypothetical protein